MAVEMKVFPQKNSPDDEKKNKTGLKEALNGGDLGKTSVRILSITWDEKAGWVVCYEA